MYRLYHYSLFFVIVRQEEARGDPERSTERAGAGAAEGGAGPRRQEKQDLAGPRARHQREDCAGPGQ
eukprot:9493516-Pyramimonas_sp.AAC.1